MAQAVTPTLEALLTSHLQIGDSKHRGEIEVDRLVAAVPPPVAPSIVQTATGVHSVGGGTDTFASPVTPGNVLLYLASKRYNNPNPPNTGASQPRWGSGAWSNLTPGTVQGRWDDPRAYTHGLRVYGKVADSTAQSCRTDEYTVGACYELAGCTLDALTIIYEHLGGPTTDYDIGSLGTPDAGQVALLLLALGAGYTGGGFVPNVSITPGIWTRDVHGDAYGAVFAGNVNNLGFNRPAPPEVWIGHTISDGSPLEAQVSDAYQHHFGGLAVLLPQAGGVPASYSTQVYEVASISIDRSRKQAAAQLDVVLANEEGAVGYYTGIGDFDPNNPIRAFAWYGAHANRVQIFTGLIDRDHEHRNPRTLSVKARSRMKWLLSPHVFVASAPQGEDEDDAVRTEDNGVYLDKTIEYIVGDILDRGGWPSADREIATTGITVAEYVLTDRTSWVDQITGTDRLATAAGCDVWEDELGVFHFEPSPLIAAEEPDPDWEYAAGVNALALDHETDDESRITRMAVGGPMTSLAPKWSEVWRTSVLKYPAGLWYDPTDDDYLRVIDRVTKYIYRLKQSDRSLVSRKYLGGHPLGLSGIPGDNDHYLVMHAPWRNTGNTSNNRIQKREKAGHAVVATYSLPNGRWTGMKSDGSNIFLTNYDDGKVYKRTMTGTAVSSHSTTYAGDLQLKPTGLWINGTTMGVFFSGHKRFLLMDTSAIGTVTGKQSTKGTIIAGGEADTDTDIDLYADADAGSFGLTSGLIAKFTLAELVETDVEALAVDWDLEDFMGTQSRIADRDHEDCPNDGSPHPFESRLGTYSMKVVQSLAQAEDVAEAQLRLQSRLRRVLDLATVGNPALQVNDVIRYTDPIAGIDSVWVLDSYRAGLSGSGTYVGSMSLLPWEE